MTNYLFVYPHQLFSKLNASYDHVVLIEDPLFFADLEVKIYFHKKKLVLHRASMKAYEQRLKKQHLNVTYVEYHEALNKSHIELVQEGDIVHVYDLVDDFLTKRLQQMIKAKLAQLIIHPTPNFLTDLTTLDQYFDQHPFFMGDFYRFQRQRLNLLMEGGQPAGGQYSFDSENRKKLPSNIVIPSVYKAPDSEVLKEAKAYVNQHFSSHIGEVEGFDYPYTRNQSIKAMEDFFQERFNLFGPYQDALDSRSDVLFHARLSSSLNIGLLNPQEVVDAALEVGVPLASKEGFIRQIVGWREFMRASYHRHGRLLRTANQHQHIHPLPRWAYSADSGILPLDDSIDKVMRTAYSHHIERLMVIGSTLFMLEINPHDVYHWFMETHIDAYDWVMVPNVYAMSQHTTSMLTTKPYFNGSNYLLKQSSYPKGDWCEYVDALYYTFLKRHQDHLAQNPRTSMLMSHLKRKDEATMARYAQIVTSLRT